MPALRKPRDDPGQAVGVRLVRRLRGDRLAASLGTGQAGPKRGQQLHTDLFRDRDKHPGGRGPAAAFLPR